MKTFGALALATLCLAAAALALQSREWPPVVTKKQLYAKNDLRGKKAPALVVEQWLSKVPDTKGKVVVVDYWATWCGPCRKLIPEMNDWHKSLGKDVVFIGLSDEPAEKVAEFMKTTPMEYYVAVDTKRRMFKAIGIQGIPHVTVISPDGIVRWQGFPGSTEDILTTDILKKIVASSGPQ